MHQPFAVVAQLISSHFCFFSDSNFIHMEFELKTNLVLPPRSCSDAFCENGLKRKRSDYQEEFERIDDEEASTLDDDHYQLLIWSGQPNEDDDDDHAKRSSKRITTTCCDDINDNNDDKDEKQVIVGWPPIKSLRKYLTNRRRIPGHKHHRRVNLIMNKPETTTTATENGIVKFRESP